MERDSFDELLNDAPVLSEPTARGDYFLPQSHMQLLEKIEHLSRYSQFIQVVTGLSGSGKTTLVRQFMPDDGDTDVHACLLNGEEINDAATLLRLLTTRLALDLQPQASNRERIEAVREHAQLLAEIPRLFLIVVDDADEMADEALAVLFKLLETIPDVDMRPHLLLVGSPALKETLKGDPYSALMSRSAHIMDLEPLSFSEMQGFVAHQFGSAALALTERQLKKLYNDSFGLPGRIPQVLEAMLRGEEAAEAAVAKAPEKARPSLRLGLVGGVVLVPLAAAALWFGYGEFGHDSERLRIELPAPEITQSEPVAAPPASEPAAETLEQRLEKVRIALERERQAVATPDEEVAEANAQIAPVVQVEEPDKTVAPERSEREPTMAEASPEVAVPAAVAQLPVAPVRAVSAAPVTSPRKLVLSLPDVPAVPVQPASVAVSPVIETPAEVSPFTKQELALLEWPSSGYTLQMLGARNEQSVEGFIQGQSNPSAFYRFHTIYKEKPWYVVIYGQYSDRKSAVAAIADLPLELRKRRPWARSVQGVQDDIRRKE